MAMVSSPTADFEIAELQQYYHLPLREAAKRLGSCEAVIKRVCRRRQIQRWPYRQVSSKLIKIQHLCKYMVHVRDEEQAARIQQKIKQLTQEYLELVGGHVPSELQLSHVDASMMPTPAAVQPMAEAEIAKVVDEPEPEDQLIDDETDNSEEESSDKPADTLSAYSLRFILSDSTILETCSGVQLSASS